MPRRSPRSGSAQTRLASVAAIVLAGFAGPARAAWECTDAWHHVYTVQRYLSTDGDLLCVPIDLAAGEVPVPTATAADAASTALNIPVVPAATATESGSLRMSVDTWRRGGGMLVLAPRMSAPAWLLPASLAVAAPRADVDALIDTVALAYGQDADLLRAIVQVESRFNPNAVSAKGAIGLMQVMPDTASRLGLAEPRRRLFEPESNLRIGAAYLRELFIQFAGEPELVIAAYNAGPAAVIRNRFSVPPFPETRGYVRDVLAIYARLRNGH